MKFIAIPLLAASLFADVTVTNLQPAVYHPGAQSNAKLETVAYSNQRRRRRSRRRRQSVKRIGVGAAGGAAVGALLGGGKGAAIGAAAGGGAGAVYDHNKKRKGQ